MGNNENLKPFEKGNTLGKGRPKGSKNRATVVREFMEVTQNLKNPITGEYQMLSQEALGTLAMINKMHKGDVAAYKALMDSLYGAVRQTMELSQAEQPIFKQLDIDVITDHGPDEDSEIA